MADRHRRSRLAAVADEPGKKKSRRTIVLVVVASALVVACVCALPLLAPLACFVPMPRTVVLTPSARVRVVRSEDGQPIAGATVVLARRSDPHDQAQGRWTATTGARGEARFARREESETVMPLMMHGVPFYRWNLCAQAPGRAPRVVVPWPVPASGVVTGVERLALEPGEGECGDVSGRSAPLDVSPSPPRAP